MAPRRFSLTENPEISSEFHYRFRRKRWLTSRKYPWAVSNINRRVIFDLYVAVSCCYLDEILDFMLFIIKEMNEDRTVVWAEITLALAFVLFVNIEWYVMTLCRY